MNKRTAAAFVFVAGTLLSSCAHPRGGLFDGQASERVYAMSQVQRRPVLLGCSAYSDPVSPSAVRAAITVRFVIAKDGSVNPGTAVATGGGGGASESLTDEAVSAARSCAFTPALLKGVPVAVRTSKVFRFS